MVVNARVEDFDAHGNYIPPKTPITVSENRLGFGSYASSNIAQRFSNALGRLRNSTRWKTRTTSPTLTNPNVDAWRAKRLLLEEACCQESAGTRSKAAPDCTQTRLATLHMYTDDPLAIVVRSSRAARLLSAWREVTAQAGVVMAGANKRQLGSDLEWIGVNIVAGLGLLIITRDKLIRAREAIARTLEGRITFGEYRALMGLLENLRFVARLPADSTNALDRPHSSTGESREGPNAPVRPEPLMTKRLGQWLSIIMDCACALHSHLRR